MQRNNYSQGKSTPTLAGHLAMVVAGAMLSCPAHADNCTATPVSGKTYYIVNEASGLNLDVLSNKKTDGAYIGQYGSNGRSNQQWKVSDTGSKDSNGNPLWQIVAVSSNKAMDVYGWSKADGAPIKQWTTTQDVNQKWLLKKTDKNGLNIVSAFSQKIVTIGDKKTLSTIFQQSDSSSAYQRWYFNPVDGSCGGSSTGDASGASSLSSTPTCDVPTPFPIPNTASVVGNGTAASCTETALKAAISSGGHITFSCGASPVTIAVTSEITVPKNTVIDGSGLIALDGGGKNRILVAAMNRSLSVRNMRFVNGVASQDMTGAGIGGAVSGPYLNKIEVINSIFEGNSAGRGGGAVGVGTASSLVISGSTFKGNKAWYGGAVYSLLSALTVVNSTFTENSTTTSGGLGDGGAIGTDGASADPNDSIGGDIKICGSLITNNKAYGNGGGAYLWAYPPDRIFIEQTTVSNNTVSPNGRNNNGLGGGMRVSNGEIYIKRSSFLSNTSESNGGGLYLECAPTCMLTNSTFYKNKAGAYGGAIFGDKHQSNNVTFASNTAGGHGGAIFGSDFILNNAVFQDNSAGNKWGQAMSCNSTGTGANVMQWVSASSSGGSDKCIANITVANPLLANPANNGGPTSTMLPAANSPALEVGTSCESIDQRGNTRKTSKCDLGAVERP